MNERDPAAARWMVIQVIRFVGVAMVLIGLLTVAGRGFAGLPVEVGYALLIAGVADVFVMPLVLARRWRTPPE